MSERQGRQAQEERRQKAQKVSRQDNARLPPEKRGRSAGIQDPDRKKDHEENRRQQEERRRPWAEITVGEGKAARLVEEQDIKAQQNGQDKEHRNLPEVGPGFHRQDE